MEQLESKQIIALVGKDVGFNCLNFLIENSFHVELVVLSSLQDSQARELVQKHNIPFVIYQREELEARLAKRRYGWLLNLYSPHILSATVLSRFHHRLNLHPGLVPECRGNDNAAWTIRRGFQAGVSLLEMGDEVDAGGVYASRKIDTTFPVTGRTLNELLKAGLVDLFRDKWPDIYSGSIQPIRQVGTGNLFFRKQTNADRTLALDHQMSLSEFIKWALAHDFHPGTCAQFSNAGKVYKIRVEITPVS